MNLETLDLPSVKHFAAEFDQLFERCDAAAMAAFFTDDAQIMAPDAEPACGREAIEGFWRAVSVAARDAGMKRTVTVRQSETVGNLGYVLTTSTLEIPSDGQTVTRTFNHLTVWKAADGIWRVVAEAAAPTPSAPATPA